MLASEFIKARRTELELTQKDIADALGVSEGTVSRWESGDINNMRRDRIFRLAQILKVPAVRLLQDEIDPAASFDVSTPASIIPPGFEPLPRTVRIPLIGSIACGEPITAEENIEDYVDAPEECNPDFALRCKGDSMIEAGIEDGDIVYIRKAPEVKNGEIAAVRIGDEATLKYMYWDRHILTLVPANKSMVPRTYSGEALEDIHIEGKAVGFTHWFK